MPLTEKYPHITEAIKAALTPGDLRRAAGFRTAVDGESKTVHEIISAMDGSQEEELSYYISTLHQCGVVDDDELEGILEHSPPKSYHTSRGVFMYGLYFLIAQELCNVKL